MSDCIFCQIVAKKLPAHIIYEDDKSLAFLDINPNTPGHALLIPKEHYQDLFETPDENLSLWLSTAKKLAKGIKQGVRAEGINLAMNNGRVAGQIIDHAHLHIIPRFPNDNLKHWPAIKTNNEELSAIKNTIIEALKN